jgi:branched-chain amino acid transport system ATP-binding protein
MLLKTHNLSKSFGGLKAVHGINFELETGEVRGLIGPNGSGKSTFFNLISGVYKPDPGSRVWFDGDEITGLEPHDVARRGLARTFQLLRIFLEMTVLENLLVGHHTHVSYNVAAAVLGLGRVRAEDKRTTAEMMDLLSFIGLADYAEMPAADLSIGQRRLLALGRAMAMKPKLLMLDEPAAGLSPVNVDNLLRIIMSLKAGDRAGLRREDRRGHAGRGQERPRRHRGLSRPGNGRRGGAPGAARVTPDRGLGPEKTGSKKPGQTGFCLLSF